MNLTLLLSKLGLSSGLSQDIMLVLFIAFVSFVYGMVLGKYRVMNILINIYVAFALVAVIPNGLIGDYQTKIIVFFALLLVLTFFSKKFYDISFSGSGTSFLWRIFAISFFQITLLLSILFTIMPKKEALGYVSVSAYGYLVSGYAPLFWMAMPLVFLFVFCKRGYR